MLASPYGILLMGHQQYINRLMGKWIDFAHWETHNNNNNKMNKYVYHLILICFSLYAWEIKRIKTIKCNQPKRMNKKKQQQNYYMGRTKTKHWFYRANHGKKANKNEIIIIIWWWSINQRLSTTPQTSCVKKKKLLCDLFFGCGVFSLIKNFIFIAIYKHDMIYKQQKHEQNKQSNENTKFIHSFIFILIMIIIALFSSLLLLLMMM